MPRWMRPTMSLLLVASCQREPENSPSREQASASPTSPTISPSMDDLSWPQAPGIPVDAGMVVYVSRAQIRFEERAVGRIVDGQVAAEHLRGEWLIDPLFEALSEAANQAKGAAEQRMVEWRDPLLLAVDEDTPTATIVKLVFTGGRAQFHGFGFVVGPLGPSLSYLPFDVPPYEFVHVAAPEGKPRLTRHLQPDMLSGSDSPDEFNELLSIELTREGLTLGRGDSIRFPPVSHPRGDHESVAEAAAAVRTLDASARRVVISAEGDVPVRDLIGVMVAARGSGCSASGDGCVLPKVIFVSGHAHDYQVPAPPSAQPSDDVWGGLPEIPIAEGVAIVPGEQGVAIQPTRLQTETVELGTPRVVGGVDPDITRRIVKAHINELRHCYRIGLEKQPSLSGGLTIDFVIGSSGKVESAKLGSSTVADAEVGACIVRSFQRWQFSKPQKGAATVSFPLELMPY